VSATQAGEAAGQRQESWSGVPARNPGFKGREAVLSAVHDAMAADGRAAVQALLGMAGVGKTQIAIEFVHRFAADYNIVWWVSAERPEAVLAQFLTLVVELGWASAETPQLQVPWHWLSEKYTDKTALSGKRLLDCFALVPR
jgi:hypothetical protein